MIELVSGHGRLTKPVSRVGDATTYENDPIGFKDRPMEHFVCRHKEASIITPVNAGEELEVAWNLSAPHAGDCSFYISYDVDAELTDMRWFKVANLMSCWDVREWEFTLPAWLPRGRAVIRWEWAAIHVPKAIEFFVQCADVDINPTASEISVSQIPSFKVFSDGKPRTLPGTWEDMSLTNNIDIFEYEYSYRSEFNKDSFGYWPQFMTGPSCPFQEMKLNNCEYTKPSTLGWVEMVESKADPVDLPAEEDPKDEGNGDNDDEKDDGENPVDEATQAPTDSTDPNTCAYQFKYEQYSQCDGNNFVEKTGAGWDGCQTCPTGFECFRKSEYYSVCTTACLDGWDCDNGVEESEESVDSEESVEPQPEDDDCPNDEWNACGGKLLKVPEQWSGKTCCKAGLTCVRQSEWWSSCKKQL